MSILSKLFRWFAKHRYLTALILLLIIGFFVWTSLTGAAPAPLDWQHVTAYQLTPGLIRNAPDELDISPVSVGPWKISRTEENLSPELRHDLANALDSVSTYSGLDTMCFHPGMALKFGNDPDAVTAVICLDCDHVDFYKGDYKIAHRNINALGEWRLGRLYRQIFGIDPVEAPTLPANEDHTFSTTMP